MPQKTPLSPSRPGSCHATARPRGRRTRPRYLPCRCTIFFAHTVAVSRVNLWWKSTPRAVPYEKLRHVRAPTARREQHDDVVMQQDRVVEASAAAGDSPPPADQPVPHTREIVAVFRPAGRDSRARRSFPVINWAPRHADFHVSTKRRTKTNQDCRACSMASVKHQTN